MSKKEDKDQPKVSNPEAILKPLSDKELENYVKLTLEPMIKEFEEEHKGQKITEPDIKELLLKWSENMDKAGMFSNTGEHNKIIEKMSGVIAGEIQKENKVSTGDKLMRGFSDFCNNIGLKKIGTACLKFIKKDTSLESQLDQIAKEVKLVKKADQHFGKSTNEKGTRLRAEAQPITNPKIGGDRGR